MSDVEIREAREAVPQNHFEYPFVEGDQDYPHYASYLSDHYICELMMGAHNWRDFGSRALRINENIADDVFLLLEDGLSLNLKHNFDALRGNQLAGGHLRGLDMIAGGAEAIANILTTRAGGAWDEGIEGSDLMLSPTRILNAAYYKESDAWAFPVTFRFRMGQFGLWDAQQEVWNPLIALLTMCAPVALDARANFGDAVGVPLFEAPGPSQYGLIGALGSTVLSGITDSEGGNIWERTTEAFTRTGGTDANRTIASQSKNVTFIIGLNFQEIQSDDAGNRPMGGTMGEDIRMMNFRNILYFDPCYIDNVTVSLGQRKDLRGYPTEGSIELNIRTVMPALANDITAINKNWGAGTGGD